MWLIEESVANELRQARKLGLVPTAKEQSEYVARCEAEVVARDGAPRNLNIAGDVAEIRIEGTLTEKLDFFMFLFGGGNTTYESIRASIAAAESDPSVKRIQFNIASPGGTVEGFFETVAAIEAARKPMTVVASQATSAAYGIAAVAGKITAATRASVFGSIGVAISYLHLEEVIQITNTESPDKRPDMTTEEGRAVVRRYLDGIYDEFAGVIARGRGTTVENINEKYGRGAVFAAAEAKKLGMVDRIPAASSGRAGARAEAADPRETLEESNQPPAQQAPKPSPAPRGVNATAASGGSSNHPRRSKAMDQSTLKAEHPALYAAVIAEGEKQGISKERDRVSAHLIRGQANGAMDIAVEAVEAGTELTETMKAKYDARGKNRDDAKARQEETDAAAETTAKTDGVAAATEKPKGLVELFADDLPQKKAS